MAVGSVYVDVVPSTRGFVGKMANDLEREGDKLGVALGKRIADGVGRNLGKQIADGLPQLTDFQRVSDAAGKAGAEAGKKFSQRMINEARKLTADLRDATQVEAVVRTRLEINKGALDEVQRDLYELGNARVNVDVDVDDAELNSLAEKLHSEQRDLKIRIDADEGRLPQVQKALDLVRDKARDMPAVRFDADYRQVDEAGKHVDGLRRNLEEADKSTRRFMSKPQEYALMAISAFTPASAAVLGFAAAGLAVLGPIAAITAGFEGVKVAASPLNPLLQQVRQNTSDAFVKGLQPAVANLATLFPIFNTGLTGTAVALSDVAVRMTAVAASGRNTERLGAAFDLMNEAITGVGPPMATLTDNTLRFAQIGASAMVVIGPILDEVGVAWTDMITSLENTGAGQAAVIALVQVLGSLLTLAAPLVQLGAEMFAAIGPGLAAAINGTAAIVSVLANAFGALPGPLQTAIAAAIILRTILALTGKTMSGIATSIGQFAGRAGQGLTAPFRAGSAAMSAYDARARGTGQQLALFGAGAEKAGKQVEDAGRKTAETATAGQRVANSFAMSGAAIANAGQRMADAPTRAKAAFSDFADNTTRRMDGVANVVLAGSYAVEGGFQRAVAGARSFGDMTGQAVERVGHAFYTLQGVPAQVMTGLQTGYNRATLAGEDFANRGTSALNRVRAGFSGLTAGPMASINALSTGMFEGGSRFQGYATAAESSSGRVRSSFSTLGGVVSSSLSTATSAVTTGASSMRTALTSGVDQAVQMAGRGYMRLGEVVGQGMDRATQAVTRGGTAIGAGLNNLTTAAGRAGTGIASGFSKAVSGITGALGGPWGAALTGAMVLLSLFGDAMARNAQKQAEFQQSVRQTSEALRDSGGAVTESMRQQELFNVTQGKGGEAARALGVDLAALTNAAISGGQGWIDMKTGLENAATAGQVMSAASMELGSSLSAQDQAVIANGAHAQELLNRLGPLAAKFQEAKAANDAYTFAVQNSGNSMAQGLGVAGQLTAAFTTLQNAMSTTEDKAKALATALGLLFGQPLSAEAALASARMGLDDLKVKMEAAKAGADAMGQGMLTASGRINLNTKAGQELAIAMDGTRATLAQAAVSAFDAAGGTSNLAAAQSAARGTVQGLRDQFVSQMTAITGNAAAANTYANELGLIPEVIVTLLSMNSQGLDKAKQDLALVASQAKSLPPGQVNVTTTLSGEAVDLLRKAGVGVVDLGNGMFSVEANDRTRPIIEGILNYINGLNPQVPVNANPSAMPGQVNSTVQGITPPPVPTKPETSAWGPAFAGAAGSANPPPVGVGADTAPFTGDVNSATQGIPAAQVEVVLKNVQDIENTINRIRQNLTQPITMILNINDTAIGAVEATKARAAEPVTFSFDANDVAFGRINATKAAGATPVTFTFDANDVAFGRVNATKAAASAPSAPFLFDANDVAFGRVNATKQAASTPSAPFLFDANDVAFGRINATKAGASTPVSFVFDCVDVAIGRMNATKATGAAPVTFIYDANDVAIGRINATRAAGSAPVSFSFDANDQAIGKINATKARATAPEQFPWNVTDNAIGPVNATKARAAEPVSFTLSIANAGAISGQLDAIAHDRTVTYRIVTVGAPPPPGNALGNIYGAYAKGGTYMGHKLDPMAAGVARKVQPNTWRVVGDRTSKPESYIPWNNSPRSKSLLAATAQAFGYALQPLASGGLFTEDTLKLAQLARQRVGTQSVGAMQRVSTIQGGDDKASEQQARQLAEIATLLREGAAQPVQVTVEDRSGNPTQTGRAAALAFRLAR